MALLGSVIFTLVLFTSVIAITPFVIVVRPFGQQTSYSVALLWVRFVLKACKLLCGLDFIVEGRENIPKDNAVVLMKHSSAYETVVQWVLFPRQTWVLKRELMWAPFLGWALAMLPTIAIDRNSGRMAVQQVIDQGRGWLSKGLWVVIFPEGTRMAAGQTRRYGVSGALLARESGRPVVPVAHNAGDFWPRRGWRKRPGTVRFCIGPPIDPGNREPREINDEVQAWIENKVAELREHDTGKSNL
jgi:1-acyl-sn-glycerol-3-phosphate acyltransferase